MFRRLSNRLMQWQERRRRRRIEKITAKAGCLEDGREYDLLFLHQKGFVRARGTGQSITRIDGEIENLIDKTLHIIITPGTYFVARGNCQNMVTRAAYSFTLHPASRRSVSINAACINAGTGYPQPTLTGAPKTAHLPRMPMSRVTTMRTLFRTFTNDPSPFRSRF